jgi:hypothetical protein
MAVQSMAYDHPAYLVRETTTSFNAAGASAVHGRFAAFTNMLAKSLTVYTVTAGTGTGNGTVSLCRIATGGTAITTLGTIVMGTAAAAVGTNVAIAAASQAITKLDQVYIQNGADATGVWAVTVELVLTPGADITT